MLSGREEFEVLEDSTLDEPSWEDQLIGKRLVSDLKTRPCDVFRCCAELIVPVTRPALTESRETRSTTAARHTKQLQSQLPIDDTSPTCHGSKDTHQYSRLLALPFEIRTLILKELFIEPMKELDWQWPRAKGGTPASIMFTCRTFYNEARKTAEAACMFRLEDLEAVDYRIFRPCMEGQWGRRPER